MPLKKHKLEYNESFDFLLFGISSHEADYKLVWKINKEFSLNFVREDNLKAVTRKTAGPSEYALYSYDDEDTFYLYHLISNKSEEGVLLEDLKNIDFLIRIQGDFTEAFLNGFQSRLKKTEGILGVFRLDPTALKGREFLLF
jgi:hypothetical protein